MKIPLLPVHVMTTATLDEKIREVVDEKDDEIVRMAKEHEWQEKLSLGEIAVLLDENLALRKNCRLNLVGKGKGIWTG